MATNATSPAKARELLWRQGRVVDFLLDANQKEVYSTFKNNNIKTQVVVLSRQSGKSYGLSTIAIQECLTRPNIIVTYVAPRLNQVKRIAKGTLREILKTCPKDLQPTFNKQDNQYVFHNGSILQLGALNNDRADDLRGSKSHLIIVDEAGFVDDLNYVLKSVLYPMLNTTRGNLLICSTPPKSASHEFYGVVKQAEFDNTLIKKTIYDCPRYTSEDIDMFAKEVGGKDSSDFRREYLCQFITDQDSAVIPEATEENMQLIVTDHTRPAFFDCYIGMDIGFKDLTAILFGYYDFRSGVTVIEDEIVIKGKEVTTSKLAAAILEKENQLWGFKKPYLRISDNNNPILLNELSADYGVPIMATAKDNKEAAINNVRIAISDHRIRINPRCKTLIFHLKNATWNKNRTSYDRTPDSGHADCVDALIYLMRNIQPSKNPFPYNFDYSEGDYFNVDTKNRTPLENHLVKMFSGTKKR